MKGWTPRVDLAVNTTQNTTTITTRCCFFFCSGPSLSALSTCHVVCLPGRNSVELDVIVSLLIIPPVFAFLHLPATRPSPPATSYLYYDPSRPEIYLPSSFVSAFFLSFPPLLRAWTYPSPPYIAFSLPRAPLLPWCVDLYSLLLWGVFVFLGSAALVLGCRVYAMHRRVLLRTYLGS